MPDRHDPLDQPTTPSPPLFAPWRRSYMDLLASQAQAAPNTDPDDHTATAGASCFLREYWLAPERDVEHHVIVRTGTEETGRGGLIMLNRYPYANGHLLVCLGASRSRMLDYDDAERAELWSLVDLATDLCERTLNPQGVNIGLNQGLAAGAGVPEHVHVHVVPRWGGDVNFMATVGAVRVIPSALDDMAARYRETWEQVRPRA